MPYVTAEGSNLYSPCNQVFIPIRKVSIKGNQEITHYTKFKSMRFQQTSIGLLGFRNYHGRSDTYKFTLEPICKQISSFFFSASLLPFIHPSILPFFHSFLIPSFFPFSFSSSFLSSSYFLPAFLLLFISSVILLFIIIISHSYIHSLIHTRTTIDVLYGIHGLPIT